MVPSSSGDVGRLRASLEQQTFRDYELIVVPGVSPGGLARDRGVARSTGVFSCLSTTTRSEAMSVCWEGVVALLDAQPGCQRGRAIQADPARRFVAAAAHRSRNSPLGVPRAQRGYRKQSPAGSLRLCPACHHLLFDAAPAAFDDVDGFNTELVKGQDTEFFYRVRRAGHGFVIPANCWGVPRSAAEYAHPAASRAFVAVRATRSKRVVIPSAGWMWCR